MPSRRAITLFDAPLGQQRQNIQFAFNAFDRRMVWDSQIE
jgi:hypothetical protein